MLSPLSGPLPQGTKPRLFGLSPLGAAAAIFVVYMVVAALLGVTAKLLLPWAQPEFVALVALSIFLAIVLTGLGWWKSVGFNAPAEWRDLRVMIVPVVIAFGLPFLAGVRTSDTNTFLYLLVAYGLTGFMEEGVARGLFMRVLEPLGMKSTVLISALLFGLMHVGNLLYRNPMIVLAQMLGAFVHGIGLGAVRLRTNTIWSVILLHGLHDLALKYTNFPAIPLDVVQVTLLMIYGIYILRSRAAREAAIP